MEQTEQAGVVVIGYGTAGVNACIGMRNAGYEGPIRVFSDTAILPYSPILTSYYAGGEKTFDECFPWKAEELDELNLIVHPNEPVTKLDPKAHTVSTALGTYPYVKCVIASGAKAATFGYPQSDYKPLVLRTMDDAQRLKDALEDSSCKRVLVSGASMIALKALEAALCHGKECALVGLNQHILDFNALPESAVRFEKGLEALGVKLRFGDCLAAVEPVEPSAETDGCRLKITYKSGDVEYYDELVVAHGVRSDLSYIAEGSIEKDRALLVDEFCRTSDADVYAAGDVAQGLELISGEKRIVGIWKSAALQGAAAGAAIAAELAGEQPDPARAHRGAIATNTIAVKNMLFISAGTMELTENRRMEIRDTDAMLVLYIIETAEDGTDRLVGFNLVCEHSDEGSPAYDTGAMLTMRIEQGCRA